MVVDLDGVCGIDRLRVVNAKRIPLGVHDADERAGLGAPPRQLRAAFALARWRKVQRQAIGQQVPLLSQARGRNVDLRTQYGGEAVGAVRPRVADREIVGRQKVVRQAHEVVARLTVAAAHLVRRQLAVGLRAVRVQVALEETARLDKGVAGHRLGLR